VGTSQSVAVGIPGRACRLRPGIDAGVHASVDVAAVVASRGRRANTRTDPVAPQRWLNLDG